MGRVRRVVGVDGDVEGVVHHRGVGEGPLLRCLDEVLHHEHRDRHRRQQAHHAQAVLYKTPKGGPKGRQEGKYRSSVVSLVSLRTRLKVKNPRGILKVYCVVHRMIRRRHKAPTLND
eukprot:5375136-Pyramimonas_sp.AAC.1